MTRPHDQAFDPNGPPSHGRGRAALLALLAFALRCAVAHGADWPTYLHDNTRSGVTSERVEPPLSEQWVYVPRHRPEPAWPEAVKEYLRVGYDQAFQVVAAGGALYFGSSADNKVYSLDASTGQVRWAAFTGGPVRVAPTVSNGRVYVGSDDGCAYCLRAADGQIVWKLRGGPGERKVLGNGRMMSVWPVRTGVLVADGISYFCAGLFPAESVFLHAVRAEDGKRVWRNGLIGQVYKTMPHGGDDGFNGVSPQGALLASRTKLYVPTGRDVPAVFERSDGRLVRVHRKTSKLRGGGTWALLLDDVIFSGPDGLLAYRVETGAKFAKFPGRRLVVSPTTAYLLTDTTLSAMDRKAHAVLSNKQTLLTDKLHSLTYKRRRSTQQHSALKAKLEALVDKQKRSTGKDGAAGKEEAQLTKQLGALDEQLRALDEKLNPLNDEWKTVKTGLAECVKWQCACKAPYSLVLAGGVLFAGGQGQVLAVDAADGNVLWTGKVTGCARGLAVSDGRLFVSTDTGSIHCFGKKEPRDGKPAAQEPPPAVPYPPDKLTAVYAAAAEAIVAATGVARGYCLVLGCGKGRLALELAKRTELNLYGLEPDSRNVAAARAALDRAGLYGVRVTVNQGGPARLRQYPDYFANLIVSDNVVLSGRPPSEMPEELLRVLKPLGGVACIGQPKEAAGLTQPATVDGLRKWLKGSSMPNCEVTDAQGRWAKIVRGPLEGAGEWTHQYANPANTACSGDRRVACPLGLLWFGGPGPARMIDRHSRTPAPLSTGGRIFIPANERVIAVDAYNGTELWDTPMPGCRRVNMMRDASDMAAATDSVFRALAGTCWRLDAATGERTFTYPVPAAADGQPRDWGYVACVGDLLFGTATKPKSTYTRAVGNWYNGSDQRAVTSEYLFVLDQGSGRLKWRYQNGIIINTAIAIGDGRVFLVESRAEAAMKSAAGQMGQEILDKRFLVALDAQSGHKLWEKRDDFSACGTGISLLYQHDTVVVWGTTDKSCLVALSAQHGSRLWTKTFGGYRSSSGGGRPVIIRDTLYADPYAYDLRTGEQKTRRHPLTGDTVPWSMSHAMGCGSMSAAHSCLFYRSGSIGIYDLAMDAGTSNWGAMRPGCWINTIPAAGLALIPEASSGCICSYPLQTTVALISTPRHEKWSVFTASGETMPVRHVAVNFGAPGDRRDREQTLWLCFPRPPIRPGLRLGLKVDVMSGGGYFRRNADALTIEGTDRPWLFSSGCLGLTRCVLPLIAKGQPPATYAVRLSFAEPTNDRAGQRVFDVKVQDRVVVKALDVYGLAGGRDKALVREVRPVRVHDALTIEFVPNAENPAPARTPVICGIEAAKIGD